MEPSGKHPNRIDWMMADLQGVARTLDWYIEQAEAGDRDAALVALQKVVASLTPTALEQNGGNLAPPVLSALQRILGPAAASGDSRILRAARKAPNPDVERNARMWWWCVRMHELLLQDPSRSQTSVAETVMADEPPEGKLPDAEALVRRYNQWLPSIKAYLNPEN